MALTGTNKGSLQNPINALSTTTPAHADNFNAIFQQLIDNDISLEQIAKAYTDNKVAGHSADDVRHTTQIEKDNWDSKASGDHTHTAEDVGAIPSTEKGVANGVATLDSTGNIPVNQLNNVPPGTQIASGTYTGDNADTRTITVGFTPKFVFVSSLNEVNSADAQIALSGFDSTASSMGDVVSSSSAINTITPNASTGLTLATNGFVAKYSSASSYGINKSGKSYGWVAIG